MCGLKTLQTPASHAGPQLKPRCVKNCSLTVEAQVDQKRPKIAWQRRRASLTSSPTGQVNLQSTSCAPDQTMSSSLNVGQEVGSLRVRCRSRLRHLPWTVAKRKASSLPGFNCVSLGCFWKHRLVCGSQWMSFRNCS